MIKRMRLKKWMAFLLSAALVASFAPAVLGAVEEEDEAPDTSIAEVIDEEDWEEADTQPDEGEEEPEDIIDGEEDEEPEDVDPADDEDELPAEASSEAATEPAKAKAGVVEKQSVNVKVLDDIEEVVARMAASLDLSIRPETYEDYMNRSDRGVYDIQYKLDRLTHLTSILYTGAHPDDESNNALVYLHDAYYANTAYVTANWGEGGENALGSQKYEQLGIIRSQELRSARAYDGGKQFYLGMFDFGYTLSVPETVVDINTGERGIYDPNILVYNLTKAIREMKPDVIVSAFTYPSTSHGHHVTMGLFSYLAINAAADPSYVVYDDNGNEMPAWQVKRLFSSGSTEDPSKAASLPLGDTDPYVNPDYTSFTDTTNNIPFQLSEFNASYSSWGNEARNFHVSQKMTGKPSSPGSTTNYVLRLAADGYGTIAGTSMMEDIDDSLGRINASLSAADQAATDLVIADLEAAVTAIQTGFDVEDIPGSIAVVEDDLAAALDAIEQLEAYVPGDATGDVEYRHFVAMMREHLTDLIESIYVLNYTVSFDDANPVPGQTITVTATLTTEVAGSFTPAVFPDDVTAATTPVIQVKDGINAPVFVSASDVDDNGVVGRSYVYTVTIPADYKDYTGPLNQPYNETYTNPAYPYGYTENYNAADWIIGGNYATFRPESVADDLVLGNTTNVTQPYAVPIVQASTSVEINGRVVTLETTPDVRLVPKVSIIIDNDSEMLRYTGEEITNNARVLVRNNESTAATVTLRGTSNVSGVTAGSATVTVDAKSEVEVSIPVTVSKNVQGSAEIEFTAEYGGEQFAEGYSIIAFTHILQQHYYVKSVQKLNVTAYVLPDDEIRIGYLATGMDDFVFDYIASMYADPAKAAENLEIIGAEELYDVSAEELAERYDTIVVGKTGFGNSATTRWSLRDNYSLLIEYANAGGNLVTHYQNFHTSATNGPEGGWDEDMAIGVMPLAPVTFSLSPINGPGNLNDEECDVFIPAGLESHGFYNYPNKIDLQLDADGRSASGVWDNWIQQRCEWTPGNGGTSTSAMFSNIEYVQDLGYDVLFYGADPGSAYRPAILHMDMDNGGVYTYSAVVWDRQLLELVPGTYQLYANLLSLNYEPADTTVSVTGVALSSDKLSLKVGESATLTATVAPADATNKALVWTVNEGQLGRAAAAVIVDANGRVTAVAEGTATVTVTTADGGFQATATITVTAAESTTSTPSTPSSSEPTTTTSTGGGTGASGGDSNVKTGDGSPWTMFVTLAVGAVAALAGVTIYRKKRAGIQ